MSKNTEIDLERLYERAHLNADSAALQENIFSFYYILRHVHQIKLFLKHPGILLEEKLTFLLALPCFKPSKTFSELLRVVLVDEDLWGRFFVVNEGFHKMVEQRESRMLVQVFSPTLLTEDLQLQVVSSLKETFRKDVILKCFQSETLIAGLVVKLPDGKMFNFSIDRVLSDLRFQFMEGSR